VTHEKPGDLLPVALTVSGHRLPPPPLHNDFCLVPPLLAPRIPKRLAPEADAENADEPFKNAFQFTWVGQYFGSS
jgi:hypothetical protein